MKRALIVAATGGFLNGFLIPDMKLLQEMGYEVHCAANGNSVSTFVPEERFASIGVTFHQIDFSSTSPVSKESLTDEYSLLLHITAITLSKKALHSLFSFPVITSMYF